MNVCSFLGGKLHCGLSQEADAEKTRHIHSLEQQLQLGQQAVGMNVDDGDVNRLQEQVCWKEYLIVSCSGIM